MPLGLGVSAIAALFVGQRDLVIVAAGALLVGLGVYVLAGGGFELAPSVAARLHGVRGAWAAYATGLAYGFAGFCTGPILGAVLTVAAASGEVVSGALLLAAYALGMAVPVFLLAIVWDRWHPLFDGQHLAGDRPLSADQRAGDLDRPRAGCRVRPHRP